MADCAFDDVAFDAVAFDVCVTAPSGGGMGLGRGYARREPLREDTEEEIFMLLLTEMLLDE